MSQQRLRQGRRLSGTNRRTQEATQEATDYADDTKLDLTLGGTVAGPLTVGSRMEAPGVNSTSVSNGATFNYTHGLGYDPNMVLFKFSTDSGTTWHPMQHNVGNWQISVNTTQVSITNSTGSTALIKGRVLG